MGKKTQKAELVPPSDLDEAALRKWNELREWIRPSQAHMLANLARNHGNLLAVRSAKAVEVEAGRFTAMTIAKNGATVVSPYIRQETRLIGLENRMLLSLRIGEEDLDLDLF